MKDFFKRHGEKIFLAMMVLVCVWSLVESVGSLRSSSVLPEKDTDAIKKIQEQVLNGRPTPEEVAPYQEWLRRNLEGRGRDTPGGAIEPRIVYPRPLKGMKIETRSRAVPGRLGRPGGLAAKASRTQATVTWTAALPVYANVVRYEVFSRKGEGERPEKPAGPVPGGKGPFSFTDSNLDPETTYSYWIRAVGKAAPPDARTSVNPPEDVTVDEETGLWFTEPAGPVSAATPSNIDFEVITIYTEFEKRAVIRVKRWNSSKNDWDVFRTEGGVAEGGRIVGRRPKGLETETLDTGYVLKKIRPDIRIKVEWTTGIVEDPPGSGKYVRRKRKVERRIPIQVVEVEKADGTRRLELYYWPGGKKLPAKVVLEERKAAPPKGSVPAPSPEPGRAKPAKAKSGGDLLARMKKEMKEGGGRAPAPVPPPGSAPAGKPSAPEALAGWEAVASPETAAKLFVPESWTANLELDDIIGTRPVMWDVSADPMATWGGSVPGCGMVVSDRRMTDTDIVDLIERGVEGLSAEEVVGLVREALKRKSLEKMPKALARGEGWSVRAKADRPVAAFAMTAPERAGKVVIAKYFALASGRLYTVTFICKEGDYGAQKATFDKIAGTLVCP